MNSIWIALLGAIVSYLIGSISTARLVAKKIAPEADLQKVDLTLEGVGTHRLKTVGATTASVKFGAKIGYLIAFLDILKGMLPVLTLRLLYPDQYYYLIAAAFVTVGHNWPIYYRFKGGGGISTTLAGFLVVDWIGTLVSLLSGLVLGTFIIREVTVVFMAWPWFMVLWLSIFKGEWPYIVYGIVMNIILTLAILPDIMEHLKSQSKHKIDVATDMEIIPMYSGLAKLVRKKGKAFNK